MQTIRAAISQHGCCSCSARRLEFLPGVVLVQHLLQECEVFLDLGWRQISAGNFAGLVKAALQADRQGKVLPQGLVEFTVWQFLCLAQRRLGLLEITFEYVRHADIVVHGHFVGLQLQALL
jgi:hypothetical protein